MAGPKEMKAPSFAAFTALALLYAPAAAQTFNERPYDPPVGSRWQIESRTDSNQSGDIGVARDQHIRSLSEFTIAEKLPDGFRVVFVNRSMNLSGSAPGTDIANKAFTAMKDIEIRARTDRNGKPVAIENLDEVKATMRIVIGRMTESLASQPKVAALIKEMLDGFLMVDGADAARLYVDEVPQLASAQNTGLKPGEVRREEESVEAPFGGGRIKAVVTMRLTSWDDKAGTARYTRTHETDHEAMQAFLTAVVKKLAAASSDKDMPKVLEMMKQVSFDMTSQTTIDVDGGMTRATNERETMTANLMGHSMSKLQTKIVTVTPLAK
jgi:hypothetical protein